MTAVLKLENICKKFGDTVAVDNISLEIADGEFLALLGPSGCGKTTLLRILGGFDFPDSGQVFMDGVDITRAAPNRRPLNMLFQSYAVFPHMTVGDNVGYGLRVAGVAADETKRRVAEVLDLVQMENFAARMPDKLSGGQRQRVALARALVLRPRVLLLDEPLSALDAKLREAMQAELKNLQNTLGITFVTVTHDQTEALSMAGRIAVMNAGRFVQTAAPRELYEQPATTFVADFIGGMNILPCIVVECLPDDSCRVNAEGLGVVQVAGGGAAAKGDAAYVAIRPEKLRWTAAAGESDGGGGEVSYPAQIVSTSYQGNDALLQCRIRPAAGAGGAALQCRIANRSRTIAPPEAGAEGNIAWAAEDMFLLRD